jgi:hypothetical protein
MHMQSVQHTINFLSFFYGKKKNNEKTVLIQLPIFYLSLDVTIDLLSIMTSMLCFFTLNAYVLLLPLLITLSPFCATSAPFALYSNVPSISGLIGI